MLSSNTLKNLYAALRAVGSYVVAVVATSMALLLIGIVCKPPPIAAVFYLLLSMLAAVLWCMAVFFACLFLTLLPFYFFRAVLARLRLHNVLYFVLSGALTGGWLTAALLVICSIFSASGSSVFWRAPSWIWMLFSITGALGGFIFWVVDVRPQSLRWPHRG
jgi:hypothetical protein